MKNTVLLMFILFINSILPAQAQTEVNSNVLRIHSLEVNSMDFKGKCTEQDLKVTSSPSGFSSGEVIETNMDQCQTKPNFQLRSIEILEDLRSIKAEVLLASTTNTFKFKPTFTQYCETIDIALQAFQIENKLFAPLATVNLGYSKDDGNGIARYLGLPAGDYTVVREERKLTVGPSSENEDLFFYCDHQSKVMSFKSSMTLAKTKLVALKCAPLSNSNLLNCYNTEEGTRALISITKKLKANLK